MSALRPKATLSCWQAGRARLAGRHCRGRTAAASSRSLDRLAFLTCAQNTLVRAIHSEAMPVILHGAAIDAWPGGEPAEALALPMADGRMRVVV